MKRHIISLYLTIVVGLTHVGIPVFAHVCHGQGEMWFSMVLPSKASCHKEADIRSATASCHQKSLPATTVNARPCCENQSGLLKIESSYCSSRPGNETKAEQSALFFDVSFEGKLLSHAGLQNPVFLRDHAPPSLIYGRELCILLQDLRC